jgi:putative tryptophan/tyrosine transport system substrate-binding protein
MKRRHFITLVGASTATLTLPVYAQQRDQKPRVAVLQGGLSEGDSAGLKEVAAFEEGLKALGWTPGRNIELVYHWPGAALDQMRRSAGEIADAKPNVVLSRSTPATAALTQAGLPVVFVLVADPLGAGFVQTLARPGGNLTGFASFEASVGGKWVGLLKEAAPKLLRIALLFNPGSAPYWEGFYQSAQAAAGTLGGVEVISSPCGSVEDIEEAMETLGRTEGGGFITLIDSFTAQHRDRITTLATHHRLPAIYGNEIFMQAGGMMAYSVDYPELFRRAASYVDRILHGARPAELPVQQPEKFALSVNLKTADAIGLTLPQALIARADEVIE